MLLFVVISIVSTSNVVFRECFCSKQFTNSLFVWVFVSVFLLLVLTRKKKSALTSINIPSPCYTERDKHHIWQEGKGLTSCSSPFSSCASAAAAVAALVPSLLPPGGSASWSKHAEPREELLWWDCTNWASVGLFELSHCWMEVDSFSRLRPEQLSAALSQSWAFFVSESTWE